MAVLSATGFFWKLGIQGLYEVFFKSSGTKAEWRSLKVCKTFFILHSFVVSSKPINPDYDWLVVVQMISDYCVIWQISPNQVNILLSFVRASASNIVWGATWSVGKLVREVVGGREELDKSRVLFHTRGSTSLVTGFDARLGSIWRSGENIAARLRWQNLVAGNYFSSVFWSFLASYLKVRSLKWLIFDLCFISRCESL